MEKIERFRGKYSFLSNFYNCIILYEGLIYNNSEAAFQAMKCENPKDRIAFTTIAPNIAKRKGRFLKLRKDWDILKDKFMYEIVKAKFTQNKNLKEKLLGTGNMEIIEGNDWNDTYWGVCNGKGQNKLGKILMKIREELRNECNSK